jgi:choline monooxygenase
LKPLDKPRDWFEQDFFPEDDADRVADLDEKARSETRWAREMRLRHALIDDTRDVGCVVWDETAAPAAEALLPAMCDWLVARYPTKYVREADSSGVLLPELDGWATGPLERIKGIEALKTCAKLVQEDLCLVKEETLEEAWDAVDESFAFDDDDDDDDDESRKLATRHTFRAGVVCFSFDPQKRHGKTLAGLHRPVPGYEEKMRHAVSRVFSGLTPEKPLWRANWALQNNEQIVSTALEWHPSNVKIGGVAQRARFAKEAKESSKKASSTSDVFDDTPRDDDTHDEVSSASHPHSDDSTFADAKHVGYMDPLSALPKDPASAGTGMRLRVEYETVTRLPGPRSISRWILFTVRTHMDALEKLDDETCSALLIGIEACDREELEYKSLGNALMRANVTAYLSGRRGSTLTPETPTLKSPRQTNNAVAGKSPSSKCPMSNVVLKETLEEKNEATPPEANAAAEKTRETDKTGSAPSRVADEPSSKEKETEKEKETPEPLFFESGRGSVASRLNIDPWPSSAWGVAKASAPPASWYFENSASRREAETVFRRGWHFCGRAEQAPATAPGSYFTVNVGGSIGASIVVVRGEDKKLRAFHNVCRHRAMEVAPDPAAAIDEAAKDAGGPAGLFRGLNKKRKKKNAKASSTATAFFGSGARDENDAKGHTEGFETVACDGGVLRDACMTCPYHGWTYDLTGALTKVPRLTGTERFDLSKNGLREIAVQVYGPFVWCAFLPSSFREGDVLEKTSPSSVDSAPPVAEWLGDGAAFLKRCGSIPANGPGGNLRFVTKRMYRVNCNWKVFVDNYLDGGYHVPVAHPALAAGVDMRTYETRVEGNTVTQTVRAAAVAGKDAKEAEATKKTSAAKKHRNQNRRLGGDASATYAYVYPNFMVNRYGPWMDTNLVTPTSATTCTVTFEYFLEPAFVNDAAFVEESLAASHVVQMEDIELCEKVQRGMRSPGYEPGRYVALEKGMYHFHRKVWEDLTDDAE